MSKYVHKSKTIFKRGVEYSLDIAYDHLAYIPPDCYTRYDPYDIEGDGGESITMLKTVVIDYKVRVIQ